MFGNGAGMALTPLHTKVVQVLCLTQKGIIAHISASIVGEVLAIHNGVRVCQHATIVEWITVPAILGFAL